MTDFDVIREALERVDRSVAEEYREEAEAALLRAEAELAEAKKGCAFGCGPDTTGQYVGGGRDHERTYRWLLEHPSRASWIAIELFMRTRLPLRRRVRNAWWQLRHYGDTDAMDALWQTWNRSRHRQPRRQRTGAGNSIPDRR